MGEVVKFKPRHEIECERAEAIHTKSLAKEPFSYSVIGDAANRAFWIGPPSKVVLYGPDSIDVWTKPLADTAPSEFCAPDGDCG